MYSQILIFSLYCDKILGKKQFKAGRVCLAHSRGDTVHHRGGHGSKSLAGHIASTVGNQREQEVEPGYQISRLTPFSPA